jgi:drug/metabolite transporter (DMT)-like permease
MGVAAVAQGLAARRASGAAVVVHPWYLAGSAMDVCGWVLSLLAMRHLPLLVVQTVLALSLAITVLLARPVLGVRISRGAAAAVVGLSISVTVVALAGHQGRPHPPPTWFPLAMWVVLGFLAAGCLLVVRLPGVTAKAVLAGSGYAGAAIGARAIHVGDWQELISNPVSWALVGYAVLGAVMLARALQGSRDAVASASAWLWVIEVVVPGGVGLLLLGDRVRAGWSLPAGVAVATAVASALLLSRQTGVDEATNATQPG